MRLIDLYYRAFKAYRNKTKDHPDAVKVRQIIKKANANHDELTTLTYRCEIETDWIENIEHGLVFIEKAIREERQFIRTEGEVIQIEKVKKVSRESVEHLARHSNLITKVLPEGEQLVPEKLYVVEKLNDYAVYENRFLYFLLIYLEAFIQSRLEKIERLMTTYHARLILNKTIELHHRTVRFDLTLDDKYEQEPYLYEAFKENPILQRIANILFGVRALLNTPLMQEVAKAPMIRPPIIKTNVLRMNPNFRAALALYDYITSYHKDGYSVEEVRFTYRPFPNELGDQFAEAIELTTFLSYQFGRGITDHLQQVFLEEEERRKEEEKALLEQELKRLKKRVREMNTDYEQYILLLEKRQLELEKEKEQLLIIQDQHERLKDAFAQLETQIAQMKEAMVSLETALQEKNEVIYDLNEKYFRDLKALERAHREAMDDLRESYQLEMNQLIETHEKKTQELFASFENVKKELENQIQELRNTVGRLEEEKQILIVQYEQQLQEQKKQYEETIDSLYEQMENLTDEKNYYLGALYALQHEFCTLPNSLDFTSRDQFNELERIKQSFHRFFKKQWKQAKKRIREEVRLASQRRLEEELAKKKNDHDR